MSEVRAITTQELMRKLNVSSVIVRKNVKAGRWVPIRSLGMRPYKFDLDAVEDQIRREAAASGSSLKTESRRKFGKISSPSPSKKKGEKRELWQK